MADRRPADYRERGIERLQTIESVQHHAAIAVERELGFAVRSYPGDASLMLVEADIG